MTHTHVAIIGGGLAGLHAAWLLRRGGVHFTLLEARDRLGGRILSVDERGKPSADGFDLGPSWYWPRMQPAIADLIAELGLAAFPQASDGDVLVERMSREGPQRFRGDAQEPLSFRLMGGTGALVEALRRDLPEQCICLDAMVTALTLTTDGISLTITGSDGSASHTVSADHVIAALPPRLLASSVTFTPPLDADLMRRWHETPTWMAPHAKFLAIYDRAFWREAGLSGTAQSMVGPMPEMHDATTGSGMAAWVTGPWQERLSLGGSETSLSEPGYLAGAVVASRRAAAAHLGA